jgi:hypothetical protein
MNQINQITIQGKNIMKEEFNNLNQYILIEKLRLFIDSFRRKKNCMND